MEKNEGAAVSAEEGAHADGARGDSAPGMDPACCADAVVVGYRDLGEIVERPLDAFSHWGAIELAGEDDLAIPQHRVVYFKSGDRIVWDKRRIYDGCRLDGVYGSTGHVKVDLSEIAARRRGWRPNHE